MVFGAAQAYQPWGRNARRAEELAVSIPEQHTAAQPHAPPVEAVKTDLLPTELLQAIFTLASEASSSDVDFKEKTILRITTLSCAQVCRQWRFVARECHALWPYGIDFQWQTPEVVADLLQISRPHPIDVGHRTVPFRIASERDLAVLDLLKVESRRIREWNVEFPCGSDELQSPRGWVFHSADQPLVTSLRYTGNFASSLWHLRDLSPTLSKLSIQDSLLFQSIHPTMVFPALTELRISNISSHHRPTVSEWFNILLNTPSLQFLALHNVVRHSGAGGLLLPNLLLPHLRLLSLEGDDGSGVRGATSFFRHLQLPASCGTELVFPSMTTSGGQAASYTELYRRLVRRRIRGGFANLTPADVPQIEIGLRSATNRCCLSFGTVRNAGPTLNWNGEHGTSGVVDYLDAHASVFPKVPPLSITFKNAVAADINHGFDMAYHVIMKAQSVRVHVDAGPSSNRPVELVAAELPTLLSRLRNIKTLILGRGAPSVLSELRFLMSSSTSHPPSGVRGFTPPVGPQKLQRIVLELGEEAVRQDEEKALSDADLQSAQRYAGWRTKRGFPVEVVVRCGGCGRCGGNSTRKVPMFLVPLKPIA